MKSAARHVDLVRPCRGDRSRPGRARRCLLACIAVCSERGDTDLNRPKNIAWDAVGNLYVIQRGANTVTKYDPQGNPMPFTLTGVQLNGPFGIAFDGNATLYVSSANPPANLINAITLQGTQADQGVVSVFAPGMANPGGVVFQGSRCRCR